MLFRTDPNYSLFHALLGLNVIILLSFVSYSLFPFLFVFFVTTVTVYQMYIVLKAVQKGCDIIIES